jgi:enoyl-CoA hydratase/carnithine racemase
MTGFSTLSVRREGAVLFVGIAAPPMNLLGPELVRDLVSLIQGAEADETTRVLVFRSADPEYFISHVDVTQIAEYRAEGSVPAPAERGFMSTPRVALAIREAIRTRRGPRGSQRGGDRGRGRR